MNTWGKTIYLIYSLIVVLWFDAKSPLVQMETHNNLIISQRQFENQQNNDQMMKTVHSTLRWGSIELEIRLRGHRQ